MNMEQWTDDFGVQFEKDENGVVSLVKAPHDIQEYSVPDYVTKIGECAFSQCYALTKISIPNSVTKIGDYAFFECFGLTSVSIPESVVEIGTCAFGYCVELTSISISMSNMKLGAGVFVGCLKLTHITIPEPRPQTANTKVHVIKKRGYYIEYSEADPNSPF